MVFAIYGPIGRDDLPGLCDRVCALFASAAPGEALCDVSGVSAGAATVDALARLQLAAQSYGITVRMRGAGEDLRGLVHFLGLSDVLPE